MSAAVTPPSLAPSRVRNPRGQGNRLREDIIDAAVAMIEESGADDVITLRAVARRVGIAAPSIYAHFPDRDAIVLAVVERGFANLQARLHEAIGACEDPVERLHAGCRAYVRFAAERPHEYRTMFQRAARPAGPAGQTPPAGMEAFAVLVQGVTACVEAGRSRSDDPFFDAVGTWIALHGFATLYAGGSDFPWPDTDRLVTSIVARQARLE